MAHGIRLAGHPLHPALVHFPIVLLTAATLSDILAIITGDPLWWQIAYWSIIAGGATAVAASVVGFVDYIAIADDDVTSTIALRHMIVVVMALLFYITRLLVGPRPAGAAPPAPVLLLLLSGPGAAMLLVGGWIGGSLVYKHGVGVSPRRYSARVARRSIDQSSMN